MYKLQVHAQILAIICLIIQQFASGVNGAALAKIQNSQNVNLATWEAPKHISSKFVYYVSGFDHERRPIFVSEIGKWPIREIVSKGGNDLLDLDKYVDQMFFRIAQGGFSYFNESERGADDSAGVMDWENFSLTQFIHAPTTAFILKHFASFNKIQDKLAYAIWINVNAVTDSLISLARPVMGSAMERIELYGTEKSKWIPKLLRKMSKDQLPPWYGGDKDFKPVNVFG